MWDVIYLAACAVNGLVPSGDLVARMDLDEVWKMSQWHLLVSACATALEAAGVTDERFVQAKAKAVRKVALMDAERTRLFCRMDELGIWHAPLKGSVLQGLYPVYGMRQMADNDILFDPTRAREVRQIMLDMGFTCEYFGTGAHDVYHKEPVCNFELHRSLFASSADPKVYAYYRDPLRLLVPDGDGTRGMHMRDEDFYVYLVAHEHKHFSGGGTGLRSLMDTHVWLRERGSALDWEYVRAQLEALGLADFEKRNRRLATALFMPGSDVELTDEDLTTLLYMADSGTYGTVLHNVANQVARYGRAGYLLRRTLPPMDQMASLYPMLERVPALLPACWAWRLASAIVTKPGTVAHQLRAAFARQECLLPPVG